MNSFIATGTYAGEKFTDSGLRFMHLNLPKIGKKGDDVPVLVVPNRAAGETFDVFQPGARLLVGGRLYPNRKDYKMYLIPNMPIQLAGDVNINRLNLSGGVGFIADTSIEDLFSFTLLCSAPNQQIIGHSWQDSLSFKMEAWGEDATRLRQMCSIGRQISVEGVLRYQTWSTEDGSVRGAYQVRVRSSLYAAFGKNKKKEEEVIDKNVPTGGAAPALNVVPSVQPAVSLPLQQTKVYRDDEIPM